MTADTPSAAPDNGPSPPENPYPAESMRRNLVDELIAREHLSVGDGDPTNVVKVTVRELRALVSAALEVRGEQIAAWRKRLESDVDAAIERSFLDLLDAAPAKGDTPSVVRDALRELVACRDADKTATDCPYCSFDPTSRNDFCNAHRPGRMMDAWERARAALAPAGEPNGQKT